MNKSHKHIVYYNKVNWVNKRAGTNKASSLHNTQAEAIDTARRMLKHSGGGELIVRGLDGKIRMKETVMKLLTHKYIQENMQYNFSKSTFIESTNKYRKNVYPHIFLSHSYTDHNEVKSVANWISRFNLVVYIDWKDNNLPARKNVNATTANNLRKVMRNSATLLYIHSKNTNRSNWVPWEIGYFDGLNGKNKIAILPITDNENGNFHGREYLGLYKHLELNNYGNPMVVGKYDSINLIDWVDKNNT